MYYYGGKPKYHDQKVLKLPSVGHFFSLLVFFLFKLQLIKSLSPNKTQIAYGKNRENMTVLHLML